MNSTLERFSFPDPVVDVADYSSNDHFSKWLQSRECAAGIDGSAPRFRPGVVTLLQAFAGIAASYEKADRPARQWQE